MFSSPETVVEAGTFSKEADGQGSTIFCITPARFAGVCLTVAIGKAMKFHTHDDHSFALITSL